MIQEKLFSINPIGIHHTPSINNMGNKVFMFMDMSTIMKEIENEITILDPHALSENVDFQLSISNVSIQRIKTIVTRQIHSSNIRTYSKSSKKNIQFQLIGFLSQTLKQLFIEA